VTHLYHDLVCDHLHAADGLVVRSPAAGDRPHAHLIIDIDNTGLSGSEATPKSNQICGVEAVVHGDLAIAQGYRDSGNNWRVEVPAVLLPPVFKLRVQSVGTAGERHDLVTIFGRNGRHVPRTTGPAPLLMHQLGRAGSTMMMRLLASHPEIQAFEAYPLEARPGLAWMHTLGVLLGEVAPGHAAFFDEDRSVTANPYLTDSFLGPELVAELHRGGLDRLRSALIEIIEQTYVHGAPNARLFVEKFRIESRHAVITQHVALAAWPNTRQIILVRDPRDLLCSRLSFNQKRSQASFDLDLTDDALSGAPTIVNHLRLAARQAAAFPDALVVRYEDLVLHPVATATKLFCGLGVQYGYDAVSTAVLRAAGDRPEGHTTTASPAASVGRWRNELPTAAADHLGHELANELERFGYST